MLTLSSTLLSAQKGVGNKQRLFKVVLSRSEQTTKGYSNSPLPLAAHRILSISETLVPDSQKAEITLRNSDKELVSIDFENYQTVISQGYKTGVARTAWVANTAFALDAIRIPTTANGYQYRCAVPGTSHATTEPTWPTSLGVRVTDGTVTWEMDGNTGDEYSYGAPMKVRVQELHSGRGILKCILRCVGIPDQLKEDKAIAEYTQLETDTNTVKALISAVCAAGTGLSSAYNGYTAITVVYDSEDSLIDTFIPADYFSISEGESRWGKIEELLSYTRCKARIGNDGKLHIFVPKTSGNTWVTVKAYILRDYVQPVTPNNNFTYRCTTAGTSGGTEPTWPTTAGGTVTDGTVVWTAEAFDYEYEWAVVGSHTFFNKTVRLRFIEPNKEIVKTASGITPVCSGSATSATSYALDPKVGKPVTGRFTSDAQCAAIAAALIERNELDAEKGFANVPMNVGQEFWDYVKVTDSRQGDVRIGNIQYIQSTVKIPEENEALTFSMALSFGKVSIQSLMSNLISAGGEEVARLSNEQILELFDFLQANKVDKTMLEELDIPDNLDDITDGISYKRLLATQISAGKIYLSDTAVFLTGYNPSEKRRVFIATPTTPYDLGDLWSDGTYLKRCTTARASGAYQAGDWTQLTVDELADGTTYKKVRETDISAGHINLYSGTIKTGTWYVKSGVVIDADYGIGLYGGQVALKTYPTYADYAAGTNLQCSVDTLGKITAAGGKVTLGSGGINIWGLANALTTRATEAGTIQCYIGADGKIYAGAGNVYLDADGVSLVAGSKMIRGLVSGVLEGYLQYSSTLHAWELGNEYHGGRVYLEIETSSGFERDVIWRGIDADSAALYPLVDNNDDLGQASFQWRRAFIAKLYTTLRAVAPVGVDMYD